MATDNIVIILIKGIVHGLLWAIFYYHIRKGWNKANFGKYRQEIEKRQDAGYGSEKDFYGDAVCGGIAAVLIYSLDKVVYRLLGV